MFTNEKKGSPLPLVLQDEVYEWKSINKTIYSNRTESYSEITTYDRKKTPVHFVVSKKTMTSSLTKQYQLLFVSQSSFDTYDAMCSECYLFLSTNNYGSSMSNSVPFRYVSEKQGFRFARTVEEHRLLLLTNQLVEETKEKELQLQINQFKRQIESQWLSTLGKYFTLSFIPINYQLLSDNILDSKPLGLFLKVCSVNETTYSSYELTEDLVTSIKRLLIVPEQIRYNIKRLEEGIAATIARSKLDELLTNLQTEEDKFQDEISICFILSLHETDVNRHLINLLGDSDFVEVGICQISNKQ
jgi:hypothetical protein